MTIQEIRDCYDQNPDLTLGRLADITGETVARLKEILMPNREK